MVGNGISVSSNGGSGRRPTARPSVDREVGSRLRGRSRRRLLAVVDRLVVAKTVQAGVNPPANVTDGLARGAHVYVLNVSFEPRERRQALVTGVASVIFLGGAGATWSQQKRLAPRSLTYNALVVVLPQAPPPPEPAPPSPAPAPAPHTPRGPVMRPADRTSGISMFV